MKIKTLHTKKGFIALFFTLGISSILLAYVATNSVAVFDTMRIREDFYQRRSERMNTIHCADLYIDVLVRTLHHVSTASPENCFISEVKMIQKDQDSVDFSFMSDTLYVVGSIYQGFVTNLRYSNFSL